jgi:hypothetical protein
MKTKLIFGLLVAAAMGITACKKESQEDGMIKPQLDFKTGSGYVSADATLPMNDTIVIGVNCARTEENDNLTRFIATKTYDGGTSTTFVDETMNAVTYTKDMTIITRNVSGVEAYSFTITNRDGLTTTKTITITVP